MDQLIVAGFAFAIFGGACIGYAYCRREDRKINVTHDIHSVRDDLEKRARRAF